MQTLERSNMAKTNSAHASWIACIALLLALTPAYAQTEKAGAPAGAQQKVAAIKESLAKNQAALKQYTWIETTQISMKGEVKKEEQKQCQYGPDGKVQKTPIEGGATSQPSQQESARGGRRRGGAIKKEIVEKKTGELKDYMQKVGALVHEYVPPDPQKIQAAQAAGNVSLEPPAADGIATVTIKDYVKQGDSIALGFDTKAKAIRSYNVHSFVENPKDDPVTLAVTFAALPDGTTYAQKSVLDVPGKKIQVNTTNSEHKKVGQ
jgi:hypothetical protein